MKRTELLSPAGNIDAVYQAIHNGADAVYMGGKSFGARAFASNFSDDEMKQAIDFTHLYGAKVYVAVNTLIYQHEIKDFLDHVERIYKLGVDALIMQDVGMISQVKHRFPDVEIHASTQMHNHNDACLKFVQSLGATRAVLAREMSIEQIKGLQCDIEKEVFIHGALCICYSGQCLFSALTQQRSGNRGKCAQSCRMRYMLVDSAGNIVRRDGEFILSPKDVALYEDARALIDAGADCLKIEGRMKSPEYVGHVSKIYSQLLRAHAQSQTMKVDAADKNELKKLFNRGFTKGHLFGKRNNDLMSIERPNHRGVPVGRVIFVNSDRIKLELADTLSQGDGIKFVQSDTGFICNKIYKTGRLVSAAHKGDTIELDNKARVGRGENVVKTSDVLLLKQLQSYTNKKIEIIGKLVAKAGQAIELTLEDDRGNVVSAHGNTVQKSKTRPTTKAELETNISKLGDTPFIFRDLIIECSDDIFVAKSQINALRREAVDYLTAKRTQGPPRRILAYIPEPVKPCEVADTTQLHILVRNRVQFEAVKELPIGEIYTNNFKLYSENKQANPNLRFKTDKMAKKTAPMDNERLLVTDHGGVNAYYKDNDIVLDYSLNALNADTLAIFAGLGAWRMGLSPELEIAHIADMMRAYQQQSGQMPMLEALVYVRHELMAMQHCVIGHGTGKCKTCNNEQYYIKDIHGTLYPVVTDENCNNYILGSLYEQRDMSALLALGIRHFRIELFDESADQSRKIVQRYLDLITGKVGN